MLPWQPHPMVTIHPWNIALALVLPIKLAAFAVASTTHFLVGLNGHYLSKGVLYLEYHS
jgi:hypothetical protein